MPGPSLFIRQQVPLATPVNDGLMSAAQAAQLAGLTPPGGAPSIIPWLSNVSYAVVNVAVLASNGRATVVLTPVPGFSFVIPAGNYDTSSVYFLAASFQFITLAPGANIDNGGTTGVANLFGTNIGIISTAPVCSPGCQMLVSLNVNSIVAYRNNTTPMFPAVQNFSLFQVQGGIDGLVESNGTQPIVSITSGTLSVEFQTMTSVGPGAVFSGSGTVSLSADQQSISNISPTAFGTLAVNLTSPDGNAVTELRKAQGAIPANVPVMPASNAQYDVQAWDGSDPRFIVGIATGNNPVSSGDLAHVLEQSGQVATWGNDGSTVIPYGVQLNFSTLTVGRVTTVGSPTDSGVFATISRSTSVAFAGAPVLGTFSGSGTPPVANPASLFFSTAALVAAFDDGDTTSGDTATGAMFAVDRPITILGATWWQPLVTLPVQLELWAVVSGTWTSLSSVTINPPIPQALNTAHFPSPIVADPTQPYAIVVYDGTNQLLFFPIPANLSGFTQPGQGWTNGSNSAATIWGPGVWLYGYGFTNSGNTPDLLVLNVPTYSGLDLLYTLP